MSAADRSKDHARPGHNRKHDIAAADPCPPSGAKRTHVDRDPSRFIFGS
jgi:hypothetical protein